MLLLRTVAHASDSGGGSALSLGECVLETFNAVFMGQFSSGGSDTEGRLAVGGPAFMGQNALPGSSYGGGYTVTQNYSPTVTDGSRDDFIGGGVVQWTGGEVQGGGNLVYSNRSSVLSVTLRSGASFRQADTSQWFNSAEEQIYLASMQLADMVSNGDVTLDEWGYSFHCNKEHSIPAYVL